LGRAGCSMIINLTKEDFAAYRVGGFPMPWLEERFWYRLDDVLGIVIFDKMDKDWSFVVLTKSITDEIYCAVETGHSFGSKNEAMHALHDEMERVAK